MSKSCFRSRFHLIILLIAFCEINTDGLAEEITKPNEPGPLPGMFVNTYTGNFLYQRTDLFIPGKGFPLEVTLSYNSARGNRNNGYGNGWSSSFGMRYLINQETCIIEQTDGKEDEYIWDGTLYLAPTGVHDSLISNPDGEFLLYTKYGIRYYFSDSTHKQVSKVEDRNGNELNYSYSSGKLSQIADPSGRNLDFSWTGDYLSQITDPNTTPERTIKFQYDADGNLIKIINTMGHSTLYTYNENGKMTGITNAGSTEIKVAYYNNENNPVSQILCDSVGYKMDVSYNQSAITTSIIKKAQSGEQETMYSFDEEGKVIQIKLPDLGTRKFTWDDQNNITRYEFENGTETVYVYDSKGNMIKETDCLGYSNEFTYSNDFNQILSATDKNGNTTFFTYDNTGNLLETKDPLGNLNVFTYDALGNLLTITDGNGNTTTFTINDYGYITESADPLGNSEKYEYDQTGNRISFENKNGNKSYYSYDAFGQIIQDTDPFGYTRSYTYDKAGNLITTTNERGAVTALTYDPLNRTTSVTDALGNKVTTSYDALGNIISNTDKRGNTYTYEYNSRNWQIKSVDPLGNTETNSYNPVGKLISNTDENGNTTSYEYDCLGRQISLTDPGGNTEEYSYDPVGNIISLQNKNGFATSYTYDAINQNIEITDALGNTEEFRYDSTGNKISYIDKKGNTTTYTYDELNQMTSAIDPLGYTEASVYDAQGRLISFTDKNGDKTNYVYDELDRQIEIIDPDGFSELYQYDTVGNLISHIDKNGNESLYSYDLSDQVILVTDPLGYEESYTYDQNGNQTSHTTKNGQTYLKSYNELNQLVSVTDPLGGVKSYTYDPAGKKLTETDENGNTTTYIYDCCQLSSMSNPLGDSAFYNYDAKENLISKTDMNGNITQFEYDGLNRIVKMIDANGNETTYAYDANGNKSKETGPKGNETSYEYDDRNLLIKMTTPLGYETSFKYDGNSNIIEEIKPDGSKKTSEYDKLNRVSEIQYNPDNRIMEYTYDANGNVTEIVTTSGTETGIITKAYDNRNQLISLINDFNGNFTKEISYEYDGIGNRISMTVDSGKVSYTFNEKNQMVSIINKYDEETKYEYDESGRRIKKTFDNGINASYVYDESGNLLSLIYLINYNNTEYLLASFLYGYDKNGNIVSKEEILPSQSGMDTTVIKYEYDDLNQLISEKIKDGRSSEYVYDEDRNRSLKIVDGDTIHYTYDSDERLLSTDSITNIWDNNGNLSVKIKGTDTTIFLYNFPNKLEEVVLPDGDTVKYEWSGLWYRMSKTASPISFALNDCQGCAICCGCHESITSQHIATGEEWVFITMGYFHDEIISQRLWDYTFYSITDALGSVRCIVDPGGYIAARYDYDAFGLIIRDEDELHGHNFYRYAGRIYDCQYGQYYYRARNYDPSTGSFTTKDPLWKENISSNTHSLNAQNSTELPYVYVENNPVKYIDPKGLAKGLPMAPPPPPPVPPAPKIPPPPTYDAYVELITLTNYRCKLAVPPPVFPYKPKDPGPIADSYCHEVSLSPCNTVFVESEPQKFSWFKDQCLCYYNIYYRCEKKYYYPDATVIFKPIPGIKFVKDFSQPTKVKKLRSGKIRVTRYLPETIKWQETKSSYVVLKGCGDCYSSCREAPVSEITKKIKCRGNAPSIWTPRDGVLILDRFHL